MLRTCRWSCPRRPFRGTLQPVAERLQSAPTRKPPLPLQRRKNQPTSRTRPKTDTRRAPSYDLRATNHELRRPRLHPPPASD
jgi:hypothetical protein